MLRGESESGGGRGVDLARGLLLGEANGDVLYVIVDEERDSGGTWKL